MLEITYCFLFVTAGALTGGALAWMMRQKVPSAKVYIVYVVFVCIYFLNLRAIGKLSPSIGELAGYIGFGIGVLAFIFVFMLCREKQG